jgi:hypothetical protein
MKSPCHFRRRTLLSVWFLMATIITFTSFGRLATADQPCGELEECRVLIEINASAGDIGFHVLFDAEGWDQARIIGPDGKKIFREQASGRLRNQKLTENFFESAEPVCEAALAQDPDDEVVTLPEFLERFPAGVYDFRVKLKKSGELAGATTLTHNIPAAPAEVDFDGSRISWRYGNDLGVCTTFPPGFVLAGEGDIIGYEVVLEPEDVAFSKFKFTIQVPSRVPAPAAYSITVPAEYLASLPVNTPLKVEVGAIERRPNGSFGNQTFTEENGFCNNANQEICP